MSVHLAPFLINAARTQTASVVIYVQGDSGFRIVLLM